MTVMRIGVLSDTHGHLPATIKTRFSGVDRIVHAGDIDSPEVLERLSEIAPVTAVRGNMDFGDWASRLPRIEMTEFGPCSMLVLHNLGHIDLDPASAGVQMVISGHLHRPSLRRSDGVWYLNPGSASFPRGGEAPSAAIVEVGSMAPDIRFIHL